MRSGTRLLDARTVSDLTGLSVPTLQRMARQGRIPHRYLGRFLRFVPAEIDAWLSDLPGERSA
jgi:excisionase family DNA binding protein